MLLGAKRSLVWGKRREFSKAWGDDLAERKFQQRDDSHPYVPQKPHRGVQRDGGGRIRGKRTGRGLAALILITLESGKKIHFH